MPPRGLARPVRSRFRTLVAASAAGLLAVGTLVGVTPVAAAEPDLARVGTVSASAEQNDADGSFPARGERKEHGGKRIPSAPSSRASYSDFRVEKAPYLLLFH